MRTLRRLVSVPLLLVLAMSSPGWARVIKMETAAPLKDQSDASVELALKGAVDTCARGALAMGLSWIRLHRAVLAGDQVIVQMIATDDDDEDEEDEAAAPAPEPPSPKESL